MERPSAFAALPVAGAETSVREALEWASAQGAEALVVQQGQSFRLIRTEQLHAPSVDPAGYITEAAEGEPLSVLGADDAQRLNLGVTPSFAGRLADLFPTRDDAPYLVSLFSLGGQTMALALANPNATFRLVSRVWVCPEGGEKFYSSGKCPTHDIDLVLEP